MENFNPIEVGKQLKGINFPIDRENLLEQVKAKGGCPPHIMKLLEKLPPKTYERPTDVTQALGGGNHNQQQ